VWCSRCGAHARRVPRALKAPCVGAPRSPAYQAVLKRLRQGLTPIAERSGYVKTPRRPRVLTVAEVCPAVAAVKQNPSVMATSLDAASTREAEPVTARSRRSSASSEIRGGDSRVIPRPRRAASTPVGVAARQPHRIGPAAQQSINDAETNQSAETHGASVLGQRIEFVTGVGNASQGSDVWNVSGDSSKRAQSCEAAMGRLRLLGVGTLVCMCGGATGMGCSRCATPVCLMCAKRRSMHSPA
jgi:hypothetical protein